MDENLHSLRPLVMEDIPASGGATGHRASWTGSTVPVPGTHAGFISGGSPYVTTIKGRYPLVMTNIAMEAMAHRNRWFTCVYLFKMVIFHGYVK